MNITVSLNERSYDVMIGDGVRNELARIINERAPKAQVCVFITSASLEDEAWFEFDPGIEYHSIYVPDGENAKTIESFAGVMEQLAQLRISRSDVVVGIGGGAVTDLAGFCAASYLRGVALIQIPTTLVGQVDAAIGGKTAVNLAAGKNLVGAFHQPFAVLCDGETLTTLPEREILGGLGEVAKCWLLEDRPASEIPSMSLHNFVQIAASLKARIVSNDEHEGGERALLNYGHTLAHALEKISLARDTDELRHGEAVAIGLGFAVRLAHALGRVEKSEVDYHDEVLRLFDLSWKMPPSMPTDSLIDAMKSDKKAHHDLTFVLPGPNGFEVVPGINVDVVRSVLEAYQGAL